VGASRSDAGGSGGAPGWWRALGGLDRFERLAALGALTCIVATALPWYRAPVDGLVKTGLGSFGFALAALLITGAAALALLIEVGRGRRPPLPLHEGTLLAAAGVWAALIVLFLIADRPEFRIGAFAQDYGLAYGVFVDLGGAVLLAVAGLRLRAAELVNR
jgi:hypothetical protein